MDREIQESLQRILGRMESLEDHLQELSDRLQLLENGTDISAGSEEPLDAMPENRESLPPAPSAAQAGPAPETLDEILEAAPPEKVNTHDTTAETAASDMHAGPSDVAQPPALPPGRPAAVLSGLPPQPVPPAPPPVSPAKQFGQAVAGFRPGAIPPKVPKESLEVRIASYWLPRIGLGLLAIAAILLAREYAQGPLGKIVSVYLVSAGLIIAGLFNEKKYPLWARPVLAGGLAFSYFGSYAMGFVEPMRLLDSLSVKLLILAVNLAVIFGVAQWKKSEVIAGTALVLGYITTGVVGNDMAAFSSSLALSVAALLFLWLNKWFVSTAVAAAATYLAHLYVWQALPTADRSPAEAFWYHSMFLSLYFLVFTAAGLAGKGAALEQVIEEPAPASGLKMPSVSRFDILTILTQVNVGAYLAGMIALLKITEVYWDKSWLFFLPMAIILGGLGLLFTGLSAIQGIYLIAATVCLTFGIAALASPMWLPVFMMLQAVLMLRGVKGRYGEVWKVLSILVLGTAFLYIASGGRIDVLRLSTNLRYIEFPWWTFAGSTALMLVYVAVWDRWVDEITDAGNAFLAVCISFAAGSLWNLTLYRFPEPEMSIIHGAAVPAVAMAYGFARVRWFAVFIILVAIACLFNLPQDMPKMPTYEPYIALLGVTGLIAAYFTEKRGSDYPKWDRWLWRGLYVWGQLLLAAAIMHYYQNWQAALWLSVAFAAAVASGWLLKSAALLKSALVITPLVLIATVASLANDSVSASYPLLSNWWTIIAAVIMACAAFPISTPSVSARTGDTTPSVTAWGQAAAVFVSGIMAVIAAGYYEWNTVLVASASALVAALFAAAGLFRRVVWVYLALAGLAAILLFGELGNNIFGANNASAARRATQCLAGVLLIIIGERAIRLLPLRRFRQTGGASIARTWLETRKLEPVTAIIAVGTLIMAVMALRILPDMQLFYFTGAMVMAAFVWIVFGFWFNEPVYRKSGFLLLCLGIAKGVIWDLWSLKQNFYRIVSGAIVGLLAIAASFLYTRFRGRLNTEE